MAERRKQNLGPKTSIERRKAPRRRDLSRALGEAVLAYEKERTARLQLEQDYEVLQRRAIEDAYTDKLTGLANRRSFDEKFPELVSIAQVHGEPLALLLVDSNRLHELNKKKGHAVGDKLLKTIAGILVATARRTDMVARVGGDEYAVVLTGFKPLPGVSEEELISDVITKYRGPLGTDASMGLAILRPLETYQELYARADVACTADKPPGPSR